MRGLYLHIPFCDRKCIYCDFYSLESTQSIGRFVEGLRREIELRTADYEPRELEFSTVFLGGGTPSLLSPAQLEAIVETLRAHCTFTPDAEWSMECNPGTISVESLKAYRSCDINRLSFGVQSFFEDDLKFLSRIHSVNEAYEAVGIARKAGFDNVNIDLMFALPHQTLDRWRANVDAALALHTEHISAYSLIFEEGTPLNAMRLKGKVREAEEELDASMYETAMRAFADQNYRQYEASNFAKPGYECLHNCIYWQGDEYLSFGPSAHGYMRGVRYWNVRSLRRYLEDIDKSTLPTVNTETLSEREKMFERAFLELRSRGIRLKEFQTDFAIDIPTVLKPLLDKTQPLNALSINDNRLSLTPQGYLLCDTISAEAITLLERHCGERWQIREPVLNQ